MVVLILSTLLLIGGMYLAVNNKVARAGREVLRLEAAREELLRTNSALQAELAQRAAPEVMLERAEGLNFRPAKLSDVEYIVVEGYQPVEPFIAPRPPAGADDQSTMLSPAFTETLGDWVARALAGEGHR
jgi:hypothetical protein